MTSRRRTTPTAYRGVLVSRIGSRWHVVVLGRWPADAPIHEWIRQAGADVGLGEPGGRGCSTRAALYEHIDKAIARLGEPPAPPVLPEL
jgi:hypothetical protein